MVFKILSKSVNVFVCMGKETKNKERKIPKDKN